GALFSVVGRDQLQRMRWVNRQIKGEPLFCTAASASSGSHRRSLFSLLIEVSFGLHLSRLPEGNRRRFELAPALSLGQQFSGLLLPLCRRKKIEVDCVRAPVEPVKRHKFHITLAANTVSAIVARFVCLGFDPLRCRTFCSYERRDNRLCTA